MRDDKHDAMDERLSSIFREGIESLDSDAFRIALMRRIEQRARVRKIVLVSSITAGALIALVPAFELTLALSDSLVGLLTKLSTIDGQAPPDILYGTAIMAVLSPLLVRLLED